MRTITFLLEAEEEMNSSAQYYNQQSSGLGLDFLEEIEKSLQLLKKVQKDGLIMSKIYINIILGDFLFLYFTFSKKI